MRRALRILPLYVLLLFVLYVTKVVDASYVVIAFLFLANISNLFGVPQQYGPLWSLSVEEHFYLVWPLAVRRLSDRSILIIAWSVVIGLPLLRLAAWSKGQVDELFYYTWYTADGLAMGAILALYLRSANISRKKVVRLGLSCVAVGLVILAIGLPYGVLTRKSAYGSALQYSPFCIMFVGLLTLTLIVGTGRYRSWINIRWLRFVGEISYGLYLVHLLIYSAYDTILRRMAPNINIGPSAVSMIVRFVVVVAVSIFLAAISRRTYEEWFLAKKEQWT